MTKIESYKTKICNMAIDYNIDLFFFSLMINAMSLVLLIGQGFNIDLIKSLALLSIFIGVVVIINYYLTNKGLKKFFTKVDEEFE